MLTQSHVISLISQDPEERNRDAKIRVLGEREIQSHIETQSTKSRTAETDQRSRMWLPGLLLLSLPSSHSSFQPQLCLLHIPDCRVLLALGLEPSLLLAAAGCVYVYARVCCHLCAVLGW